MDFRVLRFMLVGGPATVLPPRPLRVVLLVWLVYLGGELLLRGARALLG